jgi:hypothetical protein
MESPGSNTRYRARDCVGAERTLRSITDLGQVDPERCEKALGVARLAQSRPEHSDHLSQPLGVRTDVRKKPRRHRVGACQCHEEVFRPDRARVLRGCLACCDIEHVPC